MKKFLERSSERLGGKKKSAAEEISFRKQRRGQLVSFVLGWGAQMCTVGALLLAFTQDIQKFYLYLLWNVIIVIVILTIGNFIMLWLQRAGHWSE